MVRDVAKTQQNFRARLAADVTIDGPAILTQLDATTVVLPGESAVTDRYGNVIISLPQS